MSNGQASKLLARIYMEARATRCSSGRPRTAAAAGAALLLALGCGHDGAMDSAASAAPSTTPAPGAAHSGSHGGSLPLVSFATPRLARNAPAATGSAEAADHTAADGGKPAEAASGPVASAAASASATPPGPPPGMTIHVTPALAFAGSLPDIGFTVSGVWPGFVGNRFPGNGTYLSLAGPFGGASMFVVKGYQRAEPNVATIERLTRAWARELGGSTPLRAGPEQTVDLGGTRCVAEPFIIGRGLRTTNWCVALLPSRTTARTGLRVMMGVGVSVGSEPDCAASRHHHRLAPLADSIRLD